MSIDTQLDILMIDQAINSNNDDVFLGFFNARNISHVISRVADRIGASSCNSDEHRKDRDAVLVSAALCRISSVMAERYSMLEDHDKVKSYLQSVLDHALFVAQSDLRMGN